MSDSRGIVDRAARVVGDLDVPFYAEERQRDVWNEASAVGFQTLLWGLMGLAAAMVWIGGRAQFPWAIALLVLVGGASWFALAYANGRGVTGKESMRLARPRMVLFLAVYFGAIAGFMVR